MHSLTKTLCCGLRSVLAAGSMAAPAQFAEAAQAPNTRPFYAGKQITMVVGLPPGGGADTYARLVQRYLPKHIPGAPTVLVQNMPGAGSMRAVMHLNTSAPADGTVIATFSSALINEALIAPQRVRMDFRQFQWIGNVSEDVRVCSGGRGPGEGNTRAMS